jgi:hypothetical protein
MFIQEFLSIFRLFIDVTTLRRATPPTQSPVNPPLWYVMRTGKYCACLPLIERCPNPSSNISCFPQSLQIYSLNKGNVYPFDQSSQQRMTET